MDHLNIRVCGHDADHVRLGQSSGDEPFQVQGLVLPGEEPDEIRLGGQVAGNDGSKIDVRILVGDVLQGQSHELRTANDDIRPAGDHLFGEGIGLIGRYILSVDVLDVRIFRLDPFHGAILGSAPG